MEVLRITAKRICQNSRRWLGDSVSLYHNSSAVFPVEYHLPRSYIRSYSGVHTHRNNIFVPLCSADFCNDLTFRFLLHTPPL
jgi:hypothetical protein